MSVYIFDLDGTIIDSSHRIRFLKNGQVDLSYWWNNSTWEKIQHDKLLPLAKVFKNLVRQGHTVAISTSRLLKGADYTFLRENGLFAHRIFSRAEKDHGQNGIAPGPMKTEQLLKFFEEENISHAVFYDDNAEVREWVGQIDGMECVDPALYNSTH